MIKTNFQVNDLVFPTEGKWLGEQCKIVQVFPDIREAVIEINVKSILQSKERISFDALKTYEEIKDVFNHEDYEEASGKKFQEKLIIESLMDFTLDDDQ